MSDTRTRRPRPCYEDPLDPAVARRQLAVGALAEKGFLPSRIAAHLGLPTRTVNRDLKLMGFEYTTVIRDVCGTTNGYRTHHKRGEWPCDACRQAKKAARPRKER